MRIEKVMRSHFCHECTYRLKPDEYRVHLDFDGHNYCIPCGYKELNNYLDKIEKLKRELKLKFPMELVVRRLQ